MENTQYKPKTWYYAMASSTDEIKPSKCHNLSKKITTTQNKNELKMKLQ
jgi:hypothetical protein